jgi:hypothetical protein
MTQMIQVLTVIGWDDYCHVGIETNLLDHSGLRLKTGDMVEVVNKKLGPVEDLAIEMVVFDQFRKFLFSDKFYVSGWFSRNWDEDDEYVIHKANPNSNSNGRFRIIEQVEGETK